MAFTDVPASRGQTSRVLLVEPESRGVPRLDLLTVPHDTHSRLSPAYHQALSRLSSPGRRHPLSPIPARLQLPQHQAAPTLASLKADSLKFEEDWVWESLQKLRSLIGNLVQRLHLLAAGEPRFSEDDALESASAASMLDVLAAEANIIATRADAAKGTFAPDAAAAAMALIRQAIRRRAVAQLVMDACDAAATLHKHASVSVSPGSTEPTVRGERAGLNRAAVLKRLAMEGPLATEESFIQAVRDAMAVVSVPLVQQLRRVWNHTFAAAAALSTVIDTAQEAMALGIVGPDGILENDIEPVTLYVVPHGSDAEQRQEWVRSIWPLALSGAGSHGCSFHLLSNARGDVLLEKRYSSSDAPDAADEVAQRRFWARVHEAAAVKHLAGHAPATIVRYLRVTRETKGVDKLVHGSAGGGGLSRSTSLSGALLAHPPVLLRARSSAGAAGAAAAHAAAGAGPAAAAAAGGVSLSRSGSAVITPALGGAGAGAVPAPAAAAPAAAAPSAPAVPAAPAAKPVAALPAVPEGHPASSGTSLPVSIYMEFARGGTLKEWIDQECRRVHIDSARSGGLTRRGGDKLGFGHVRS